MAKHKIGDHVLVVDISAAEDVLEQLPLWARINRVNDYSFRYIVTFLEGDLPNGPNGWGVDDDDITTGVSDAAWARLTQLLLLV